MTRRAAITIIVGFLVILEAGNTIGQKSGLKKSASKQPVNLGFEDGTRL